MARPRKDQDPLSDRARALQEEIARLEAEINRLDARLQEEPPEAPVAPVVSPAPVIPPGAPRRADPIFEELDKGRLDPRGDSYHEEGLYNDLGVRKYDLPGLWRRIANHFRGPSTSNPKLVSYLAAGGIQGLSPLRYEKRVARNRFFASVALIFLFLLGIIYVFAVRNH